MIKKVFFLQDIIPTYRVPVFKRIGEIDGVDLTVFFSNPSNSMKKENLRNAPDIDLSQLKCTELPLYEIGRFSFQLSFLKYIIFRKPNIVISGQAGRLDTLLFLIVCRFLGIRFLWFLGGVPFIDPQKITTYTNRGLVNRILGTRNPRRWLINRANGMIVYSEHAKGYFNSLGFPRQRIWIAPNSPDTETLQRFEEELSNDPHPVESLRKNVAPNKEKIVFLLGRLNKGRKADILIRAIHLVQKEFPKISIVIIGDGPERKNLECLSESLRVNGIFFEGAIYDERQLATYFKVCDIFITPGAASMAIKMAMLFGKPIITADYGLEIHAIENFKNGFIFPDGDYNALSKIILFLLNDEKKAAEVGAMARKAIQSKINIHKMVDGFRFAIFSPL